MEVLSFFADGMRTKSECQSDVRVVQIIRRADADVFDCSLVRVTAEFLQVPVKAFEFREERGLGEVLVDDADRIVRVQRGYELIACFLDRLQVPGCDVSSQAREGKVCHLSAVSEGG